MQMSTCTCVSTQTLLVIHVCDVGSVLFATLHRVGGEGWGPVGKHGGSEKSRVYQTSSRVCLFIKITIHVHSLCI